MAFETERKFLVNSDIWRKEARPDGIPIRQGYLAGTGSVSVRARIKGDSAFLTIKGRTADITRLEYEYQIPMKDAEEILEKLSFSQVTKTRHIVPFRGKNWDVDVFSGPNDGLIMAEIELGSEEETFEIPEWAGEEVTGDPRYQNSYLARHPINTW